MMPRISVVPKISIRKKPLAISGMITRIKATSQVTGLLSSGHARSIARRAAEAGWLAWSWVPWINDMSSPREQALRAQRQHQHHDQEGHDDELDLHTGGGQYVAIVDAGADDDPDPGAIERKPHGNADHDGGGEDHEPYHRV